MISQLTKSAVLATLTLTLFGALPQLLRAQGAEHGRVGCESQ